VIESAKDSIAGYLVEYETLAEAIRQTQRELNSFLALSLAASGLILGLLMRTTTPRSPAEACFLISLAAGVTLVAERMTIRGTQKVRSIREYLRIFVEPYVDGLDYHRRTALFLTTVRARARGGHTITFAYAGLTAAFVLAWLAAPVESGRQWWHTCLVGVLGAASLVQVGQLIWLSVYGWQTANNAWATIKEQEQQASDDG
jgi:hypothetical protein